MSVSEKEFAIIREISNNHQPSQRLIAQRTGFSLGLTNIIIKRLIKKGYLKISTIPPRRIQYILTPKGFAEKAQKSYHFTLRTVTLIKAINENIQEIITDEYVKGAREFSVCGNGELSALTEIAFQASNLKDVSFFRSESSSDKPVCNLMVKANGATRQIDILSELSKRGVYY